MTYSVECVATSRVIVGNNAQNKPASDTLKKGCCIELHHVIASIKAHRCPAIDACELQGGLTHACRLRRIDTGPRPAGPRRHRATVRDASDETGIERHLATSGGRVKVAATTTHFRRLWLG